MKTSAILRQDEIEERFLASLYCRGYISREAFHRIQEDCFKSVNVVTEEIEEAEQLSIEQGGLIEED